MTDANSKKTDEQPLDFQDQVLYLARSEAALNYPNTSRENCPDNDFLIALAKSRDLPDEQLKDHLLHCSPCFLAFRRLREDAFSNRFDSKKKSATFELTSHFKKYALVGSIAASFLLTILFVTSLFNSIEPRETAAFKAEDSKLSPTTQSVAAEEHDSTPMKGTQGGKSEDISSSNFTAKPRRDSAVREVLIDSTDRKANRGAVSEAPVNKLPNEKLLLRMRLAPGSPPGSYVISVLDEFGRELVPKVQTKSKGTYVSTRLNLTGLKGPVRICVGLPDEIPDCSSVTVGR